MYTATVSWVLRIGLAFAFLYPPVASWFDAAAWIGYFPQFLREMFGNDALLLHTFGVLEILMALWILSGKYLFYAGTAAAGLLTMIVLFNWTQMDVLFRDLSIAALALALAFLHKSK